MTPHRLALAAALTVLAGWSTATQPAPALQEVLARAGAYVERFERQLSGIVAEEVYSQEVHDRSRPLSDGTVLRRRLLKSDLLLLRPGDGFHWVQFRDVFEVDGRPVRDREERLTSLVLQPNASSTQRVGRIRRESARYNLGDVERTMNVPVMPLAVLNPNAQSRFDFWMKAAAAMPAGDALPSVAGNLPTGSGLSRASSSGNAAIDGDIPSSPRFRSSAEVWTIGFEERRGPTIVRTPSGADLLSRGRFWIEPASGRVFMAEFIIENSEVRAQINISYQSEPLLGFFVPVEMHEHYRRAGNPREIVGTATYGTFRRIQVPLDERLGPIR